MSPAGEVINTLLMLGAAQGLFLAVLLATKRANYVANRLLAIAMLAFTIYILQGVFYARGWYEAFPHIIGVAQPLIYLFGPLWYLYAKTVSDGAKALTKSQLLHFLPTAAVTAYRVPFYLSEGDVKVAFLRTFLSEGPSPDLALIEFLQYPHGIVYALLTIGVLRRHRACLRDTHSYFERINLLWLRNLTIGVVAVWAFATALYVFAVAGFAIGEMEPMLTRLAVSAMVYAVGYLGLRQPEIFHPPAHSQDENIARASQPAEPPRLSPNAATGPRQQVAAVAADDSTAYEKSRLGEAQAQAYLHQLLRLMDERKPYKNAYLTLQDLADMMSISAHNLSQVINARLGKNFYDFVNGYRAEEVKRRLADPKAQHLTILAIGLDAGFNTKSTFNAFFKKHTGLTPSQYRAAHPAAA